MLKSISDERIPAYILLQDYQFEPGRQGQGYHTNSVTKESVTCRLAIYKFHFAGNLNSKPIPMKINRDLPIKALGF
jgi:hypothetical protein